MTPHCHILNGVYTATESAPFDQVRVRLAIYIPSDLPAQPFIADATRALNQLRSRYMAAPAAAPAPQPQEAAR